MSLAVQCPACDKRFNVNEEASGKKVRCPECANIFKAPAKSDNDDFLSGLDQTVRSDRKRHPTDDDRLMDAPRPPRKSNQRKKPKSRSSKSAGAGSSLIRIVIGAAILVLSLVVIAFVLAIVLPLFQVNFATWKTFKHPTGVAAIDMPGTPTFDQKQSTNEMQGYSLATKQSKMTLVVIRLPADPLIENPNGAEFVLKRIETLTLSQMKGARKISSQYLPAGTVPGMELKTDSNGEISVVRTFLFSNSLVVAEHLTRNETLNGPQRERFFNSLRGPDGNLVQATATTPAKPDAVAPGSSAPNTGTANLASTLSEARRQVQTRLVRQVKASLPVAVPPDSLARIVHYDTPGGKLAAYITTIPQDGKRHPAIIWISGGDCNTIDDGFFKDSPVNNDQTASAFWKAGIVTMYPSLRGGNDNPGFKEGFLGEIDDVLAALDFLSKQDGIDPGKIYLGGHSTGGTVALLVAETSNRFRAVFSFGPVSDIRGYGDEFIFFDAKNPAELKVRNPDHWIGSIQGRTFVLEGSLAQGNSFDLQAMSNSSQNPRVTFLGVPSVNHFSILAPATKLIATKIQQDQGPQTNINLTADEIVVSLNSINSNPQPSLPMAKKSDPGKKKSSTTAGPTSMPAGQMPSESMTEPSPEQNHGDDDAMLSETVGGAGGSAFQKGLGGKPMIGVDWQPGQWAGTNVISSISPVAEKVPPKQGLQRVKAPRGYAVGGIKVYAPQFVTNIQLIYMKVDSDGTLDPTDSKLSEWLGGKPKGKPTEISGEGKPVVGLHGRGAAVLDAIGIMLKP